MKYIGLKVNNKMVRSWDISQGSNTDVVCFCEFTDDINLAMKFTKSEFENNVSGVGCIKKYFEHFTTIVYNMEEVLIDDFDFFEIDL